MLQQEHHHKHCSVHDCTIPCIKCQCMTDQLTERPVKLTVLPYDGTDNGAVLDNQQNSQ